MMHLVENSSILVSETKRGLKKFWRGNILFDGTNYFLQSESWQELKDGNDSSHNLSVPYIVVPKNIGKSNETAPLEQARFELASMIRKQQDSKGYAEVGKEPRNTDKLPLPMLAHKYRDHAKKITYPAYVQRKLDGNRMIFNGKMGQSRGGKPVIPEVIQHLQFDTRGYLLDGELMLPDNPPLQTTMTAIKKFGPLSKTLIYHVYDLVDETLPFSERMRTLRDLFRNSDVPENVRFVETYPVHNEREMQAYHEQFVLEGFEGTIIRNSSGMYDAGHRSYDLQKHKDFFDQEYKIIDVVSGEGLYAGCAILVCETENGKQFRSNPEGTIEHKKNLFSDRNEIIGKYATIRYFSKSNDGIPIFNITVNIRDYGEF